MSKGNMLQGMARGKVGDIVFSRLNGEQIARVRNRYPKNPRTNAQLYQRALMATVMQAYSAGKAIFDHSFQGYAVGAENQRRFLSENAKRLRALIASDLDNAVAVANQEGRVVAPGVSMPVPGKYKVSEGSLTDILLANNTVAATASEEETVAEYCARLGIQANDLYTLVGFAIPADSDPVFELLNVTDDYSKQFPCNFYYARYSVKATALTSTDVMDSLGKVLQFNEGNFTPQGIGGVVPGEIIDMNTFMPASTAYNYSYAFIRSRVDEDLRSTAYMNISGAGGFGIVSSYALAAWKQGTVSVGNSDLILEGGDE